MARQILGKVVPTSEDTYDNNRTYDELCIVMYNGQSYISKKETRGNKPDNTEYWQQLVEKPVKGADYFTEADKDEIVNDVTNDATNKYNQAVATGIETFNQNAERKTSDFNDNVSEKTDTYNANADSTTQAFTNNANSKTDSFNTNATEKLGTYNSNHTAKLKEYNDNATSKLSAYNTNTVAKTTEYNSNHTSKLNAYNTNASNKVDVYDTNADAKLEEYNTNADNKIAEYDEHSKELNNKIVSTRNELERLKSNVLNTGEDTDTFIHLEDSAMAELQEIKVDGVLQQNTTTGKNIVDFNTNHTVTTNGITFSYVFDNEKLSYIELNGTSTNNIYHTVKSDITLPAGTYKSYNGLSGVKNGAQMYINIGGNWSSINGYEFTFDKETTISMNIYVEKNSTLSSQRYYPMITIGSNTNDTYEPYTGGQSPNPDFPQEIKTITGSLKVTSCGKNLINSSAPNITTLGVSFTNNGNGTYTISGTIPANKAVNFAITTSKPILQKGKTYTQVVETISGTKIGSIVPSFIKQDGSVIFNYFADNQTRIPAEQLVNNAYNYYYSGSETEVNWTFRVMLCEGSNATYEDYIESQIQAKLPENEFIGKLDETYKDTLRAEYNKDDGQYHLMLDKKVGKYTFTGNETWSMNYGTGMFHSDIFRTASELTRLSKCTHYIYNSANYDIFNSLPNNQFALQYYNTNTNIFIKDLRYSSIDDFKNMLKTNNIEIYYILQTPYTLDLGVIDMPMSYKDITNIFTDSDLLPTISAKYYRVFDKTIQNAQINEKTLKQEITDLNATVSALDNRLKALETKTVEEPTESEGTV